MQAIVMYIIFYFINCISAVDYTVELDLVLNGPTIQTFFGISLTDCWIECSNRPSCSSINFHSSARVCFLRSASNDNSKLEHQPGFVYRQKISMYPVACGSNTCHDGETCNTLTNDCEIRECPALLETPDVTVLGNVWSVGSKAILKCQRGYVPSNGNSFTVTTVCGENGIWSKQLSCVAVCYFVERANKYNGILSETESGLQCQRWDAQSPHVHTWKPENFPEGNLDKASNYCRDPDYSGFVWCYTMSPDVRWQACDVPICEEPNVKVTCIDFGVLKTEMMTNVAMDKLVTLSSKNGTGSHESQMVAGVRNSSWPCPSTLMAPNPYAVIDLLQSYPIRYIYVLNRADCCAEQLHNLSVWVGETASDLNLVAYYLGTVGAECTIAVPQTTAGRYVKLQIMAAKAYLTLCEVEIYT